MLSMPSREESFLANPTRALIDADMLCFTFCASAEHEIEWSPDFWTLDTDLAVAKQKVHDWADMMNEHYWDLEFYFSSSLNYRKDLDPSYKSNRVTNGFKRNGKPIGYSALRAWMEEEYGAREYVGLEGDDAMGINMEGRKTVCLSGDKDLKTVPGYHAPLFEYEKPVWVTNEEADYNWYLQTLTGDTTDGYKGCPGYGPKTAIKFLEESKPFVASKDGYKKGKEKGTHWECIVSAYQKNGYSEDHAVLQARLARILRPGEYDFEGHSPILWSPQTPIDPK